MIGSTAARDALVRGEKTRGCYIRLKVSPANREDAWDLCRVALHYGGVEVQDCCFRFPNKDRRAIALEALRSRFGQEYLEALDMPEPRP